MSLPNRDHYYVLGEVELDRFEAERGSKREIVVADTEPCGACDGLGTAPGSRPQSCGRCSGKGTTRVGGGRRIGRWLRVEPCAACGGDGRFQARCSSCRGTGEVARGTRTVDVRIPAGVDDGATLRLAGNEGGLLLVHVGPGPRESRLVQVAAVILLLAAVGLLVYFLL